MKITPSFTLLVTAALTAPAAAQNNALVSASSGGVQGDGESRVAAVSGDGRYVAFASEATNLVPNDLNGTWDVFWRDTLTGVTRLVSVTPSGSAGDGMSLGPSISRNGRQVVFQSRATDLTAGGNNTHWDIFLRDMVAGTTSHLSVDSLGNPTIFPSERAHITPGAGYVTFESLAPLLPSDTNVFSDVYRLDLNTGQLALASSSSGTIGNGLSRMAQVSDNGRFVCFLSSATNFVPGDTNLQDDVFRADMVTGQVLRMNVSSGGAQTDDDSSWPRISGDGSAVCFISKATTLAAGAGAVWNLFAHDVGTGSTEQVNVTPSGLPSALWVSWVTPPDLDATGRYVLFASAAPDLVAGDTNDVYDVFLRDRAGQATAMVTRAFDGSPTNGDSRSGHLTGDRSVIVFDSEATNLVPGDVNGLRDVFAYDPNAPFATFCTAKTALVCGAASISAWGSPSASTGSGFTVAAGPARSCKSGLLLYNTSSAPAAPFQGGSLCLAAAGLRRAGSTNSTGTPGPANCNGYFTVDVNAFALGAWAVPTCNGTPSALPPNSPATFLMTPGTLVHGTFWGRDSTSTGSLVSNALQWSVGP